MEYNTDELLDLITDGIIGWNVGNEFPININIIDFIPTINKIVENKCNKYRIKLKENQIILEYEGIENCILDVTSNGIYKSDIPNGSIRFDTINYIEKIKTNNYSDKWNPPKYPYTMKLVMQQPNDTEYHICDLCRSHKLKMWYNDNNFDVCLNCYELFAIIN